MQYIRSLQIMVLLTGVLSACGTMNDIAVVKSDSSVRSIGSDVQPDIKGTDAASKYINRYSDIARAEMEEFGIPASITLAQGLLESDAGRSTLASGCNNHFGIKCHSDWSGGRTYKDDDRKNECFRCYETAAESFRDHSLFLKNGKRYAFLFELKPTDYKGWAKGLKTAGYATSPVYADKLIEIIERYGLDAFDVSTDKKRGRGPADDRMTADAAAGGLRVTAVNGVMCVKAVAGMSLNGISEQLDIPALRLRRYNDLKRGMTVAEGTPIYIEKKKLRADRNSATHVVGPDDSLWSVSQKYGIRLESLVRRNGFEKGGRPSVGQVLKLR